MDREDILTNFLLENAHGHDDQVDYLLDSLRELIEEGGAFTPQEIKRAYEQYILDFDPDDVEDEDDEEEYEEEEEEEEVPLSYNYDTDDE